MGQRLVLFGGLPNENETGGNFRFGGGIDFYFTPTVAIEANFSYVLAVGDINDNDLMSLGASLLWRF